MRKFKLRDQVARKMKGIESEEFTIPGKSGSELPVSGEPSQERTEEKSLDSFHVCSRTDIGLIRKSNQDAVILDSWLMGVADGMGGHNGGETASSEARDGMIRETKDCIPDEDTFEKAIQRVNTSLWEMQLQNVALSGMGTTLTVLWPAPERMLIGQVGDSRAYLLRNGEFSQVTKDHSMVADMVRRGMLTEEQAACHPMRNYITRAVGTEPEIKADITSVPRMKGDRWLVCSDGLYGSMDKQRLSNLLSMQNLDEAADQMIREALDAGGRDNITLILAEDQTGGAASDPADDALDETELSLTDAAVKEPTAEGRAE